MSANEVTKIELQCVTDMFKQIFKTVRIIIPETSDILTKEYLKQIVVKLLQELDKEDLRIIVSSYGQILDYLKCVNFNIIISNCETYNIEKLSINSKSYVMSILGDEFINKYPELFKLLEPLYNCVDKVFLNFSDILDNFKKYVNYQKYDCDIMGYKSTIINYQNENEVFKYLDELMDGIFYVLRVFMKNNVTIRNKIGVEYEKLILDFMKTYIPLQYYQQIFSIIESLYLICTSIDMKKMVETVKVMKFTTHCVNSRLVLTDTINSEFTDPAIKNFVLSLVNKLSPICDAIDYLLLHPKEVIINGEAFVKYENKIFEI